MVKEGYKKMNAELIAKYKQRLEQELELTATMPSSQVFSREYDVFRKEILPPHMGVYEKVCNACEKLLKLKANPQAAAKLQSQIDNCHLQVSPGGVLATSYVLPTAFLLLGVFFSLVIFSSTFFALFTLIVTIAGIVVLQKIPQVLSNTWRMKTSNQMVLCIFYVVTYMRHTSNLELAIEFASEHLSPP